jgi:hypothetical protein
VECEQAARSSAAIVPNERTARMDWRVGWRSADGEGESYQRVS